MYLVTVAGAYAASVVASTLTRTLVETARPSDSRQADVRDKEINRFGEYACGTWP